MTGRYSDYQVEKWLSDLQENTWLALHYDNPDVSGAYNSEVFGSGYARKLTAFTDASNRAIWNAGSLTWHGLPAVIVTHVAGWNASINGDYLFSVALPKPIQVLTGGRFSLRPQDIAMSLD